MTSKIRGGAHTRISVERLMWGDVVGASPLIRELAETARKEHQSGLTEKEVRQRIRSRMDTEGLSARAVLLPNLTRRLMRIPLRRLLHELADHLANKAEKNKLGPEIQRWLDKVGFDKWLEDYLWTFAQTGESSPIYEAFTGKVVRNDIGPEGEKTPTVWLVATPYSDIHALVEEFIETCRQTFPDETFTKRFDSMRDGARYLRIHESQNISYGKIAREELQRERPDLEVSSAEFKELLKFETKRITKAAARAAERADRIIDFLSSEFD